MSYCVLKGCTNRNMRKNKKQLEVEKDGPITFHRFPKDAELRKKWMNIMKLKEEEMPKKATLCSQHFQEEMIDRTSLSCVRLRKDALPCRSNASNCTTDHNYSKKLELSDDDASSNDKESDYYKTGESMEMSLQISKENKVPNVDYHILEGSLSNEQGENENDDRLSSVSLDEGESESCSVPAKMTDNDQKFLQTVIRNLKADFRKKIKTLRQQNRRKDMQILSLKNIIKDLKEKSCTQGAQFDNLENLSSNNAQLLERRLQTVITTNATVRLSRNTEQL